MHRPSHLNAKNFKHQAHHHCESGAVTNLYNFYGLPFSEAMVFGLGAGIFFAHTNLLKTMGAPVTTYRIFPGKIFQQASKSLGIEVGTASFISKKKAQHALNEKLKQNIPVGLLTDMYYLEYMPDIFRFHFNAHNIVAYGMENDHYMISDSILEIPVLITPKQLQGARFTSGLLSPRGKMYWVTEMPDSVELRPAIAEGIRLACKRMTTTRRNGSGWLAIQTLAKRIAAYPRKHNPERAAFLLLNIVRMQEVVGTGGGGFRPLYSAFLKEAAEVCHNQELAAYSEKMQDIANAWRSFAIMAARCAKTKGQQSVSYQDVSDCLMKIAQRERDFFTELNTCKIV